jgi:predicted CopG family antitoxin
MTKNYSLYKTHTIAIDDSNYQTLKEFGNFGDSFNDVITELINIAKKRAQGEDQIDGKC